MTTRNTNRDSQDWNAGLYDDKHAFVWRHGEALLDLLTPKSGERILDLGCGTGHLTARIVQAGAAVVGLDHSAEMLEKARSAYPTLEFVQADARSFTFTDPFDAVFSNATLHWIHDAAAVVRCIHSALKPGGRFVAELGGKGNVRAILDALRIAAVGVGMRLDEPLWYFPSVAEYTTLLEAAGMEVTFAALFERPTPLEGEGGLRDWVRMFARKVLDEVPVASQDALLHAVEEEARPRLFRDGVWIADYRRLQIIAIRRS